MDLSNLNRNAIAILLVRLFAGFVMFFAGFEKAVYIYWGGHTKEWSVLPSLAANRVGGGILHDWFASIGTTNWVSPLVYWGQIFIGLGILLGLTLRLACYFGIIENGLIWASAYMATPAASATNPNPVPNAGVFGIGWANGPLELNAALIMMYIVMIGVGAGLTWGLDSYVHKLDIVKKNVVLRAIFG